MPAQRERPGGLRQGSQRLLRSTMAEEPSLSLNGAVHRIGPRVRLQPDTLRSGAMAPRGAARRLALELAGGVDVVAPLDRAYPQPMAPRQPETRVAVTVGPGSALPSRRRRPTKTPTHSAAPKAKKLDNAHTSPTVRTAADRT